VCIDEPCIELCFQLRGAAERVVNASDVDLGLGAGETSVVVVPAFRASHELERDLRGAAFDVTLSRSYFMELAGRHPELLQGVAEMLLANRFGVMSPSHMRITPQMWGIIQRIQSDTAAASVGSLFFEAAILELLALQLQQPQRSVVSDGIELSRAEVDGLHAVRDLLLGRIDDPPRLAELARHAMTNEYKLKRGFKALFGISPYAYLLQHRLELARRYLLDTDRSIAEIARRVGYRDPAHFTNAFRKGYGVRPSDLRRSARV
jgi:AraC-like DNA-binding protein